MAWLAAHSLVSLNAGRSPGTAPKMGTQPQLEPPASCVTAEKPSASLHPSLPSSSPSASLCLPLSLSASLPLLISFAVFCGAKGSNLGPFPELYVLQLV